MPNKKKGQSKKKKREKFRTDHPEGRKAFAKTKRATRIQKETQRRQRKRSR